MIQTFSDTPLDSEQRKVAENACEYVRTHKKEIIKKFAGDSFAPVDHPVSIFMAGSPGAGKTEFSKSLVKLLEVDGQIGSVVRIDGDEIRSMLPGYTGSNAYLFQHAISIGVSKLHDYVLEKRKSFILDGTFSHIDKARENIRRSIKVSRRVVVAYVYQDPILSWKFTQKREALEGRRIPAEAFVEQFLAAREVVQAMKDEWKNEIDVWLIERNLEKNISTFILDVTKIDNHIRDRYSKEELLKRL